MTYTEIMLTIIAVILFLDWIDTSPWVHIAKVKYGKYKHKVIKYIKKRK